MPILTLAVDDPLQPLAFFFRRNFARNAGVVHRRHIDQKTPRQRDMTRDARTLLPDWLFGDLYQNLLALFQQIRNQGDILRFASAEPPTAAPSTRTVPVICWALGSLCVGGGCSGRPDFDSS